VLPPGLGQALLRGLAQALLPGQALLRGQPL